MCPVPEKEPTTRDRILLAASELFAEFGFRHVSVRQICAAAEVNIAAVNYHFGDKERLYEAVLLNACEQVTSRFPYDEGVTPDTPADAQLRVLVRALLRRMLAEGQPAWQAKLMAREMAEPSPALALVAERAIRPLFARVCELVRALTQPGLEPVAVERCANSIVGQCVFYKHARHVLVQLGLETHLREAAVEAAVDHIVDFSLGGLRAVSEA